MRRKTVVVTGASAGVGRATARLFARQGANVVLIARGRTGLDAAAAEVEAVGGRALVLPADVADHAQVEAAAAAAEEAVGPIDVWVNDAFTSVFAEFVDIGPEEFKRVTEVTYLGCVYGTMAALKRMVPRDAGTIVQVGSALGDRSIPLQSAYCGAKHAVNGFTSAVRTELLHRRSRVDITVVQLPAVNTPQFSWVLSRLADQPQPVPPIYQPEVGAEAILFAARNDRREMYVGYPTVEAIVGDKIAPGLADRYLAGSGYGSQQTGEPVEPDRRDNLWEPLPGDHGAHGSFDERASASSPQLWASMNRNWLLTAGAGLAGLAAGMFFGRHGGTRTTGGDRR